MRLISMMYKVLMAVWLLGLLAGCCALPDIPGPVGIPGC